MNARNPFYMGIDVSTPAEQSFNSANGFPEADDTLHEVGDIVSLIVGGPDMVVIDVCEECGSVEVAWIKVDGDVMVDTFPEEALV